MQKYIDLLESQLGYSEKSGDYTKFGDWYGKNIEFDADYASAPWCDMYLSWAAHKLGYEEWIGQFAWTVAHAKWFKEQDAWGKTPKVGAFVFYDWSGTNSIDRIDHVGIVTRIEGDTIYTIEGNIDGGVAKRKERDTSKVVGYGYPQRVKERLDKEAAKKEAPIEIGDEALSSMIPRPDGDPVPLIAHPGESAQKQDQGRIQLQNESPAKGKTKTQTRAEEPARQPATSPQKAPQAAPSGTPTGAPKKGKHAKPATADTTAETAKPLPTHVDASAGSPLPSVDSPTLIGSALVAAIALLAVAKTRRLRLAPAPAAAASSRPSRPSRSKAGRRRRRRATTAPVTATVSRRDPLEVLDAPKRSVETPRHRRLETRPFDLATDAAPAQAASRPHRHAAGTKPLDTEPFTPAFDADPFEADFDRSSFAFTEDTGTIAAIQDDTGPLELILDTGPLRRVVDTGPFERIVIPGATSPWDAFAPSRRRDISATYRGRRRSPVVEEGAVFQTDAPPRGRRHRQAFPQETPLRGRRHRAVPDDDGRLVGAGGGRGRHRA
ncbi:CHAP domain-containing protein [Nonomuraea solani]|uniref:CHAP domain-containing protein n=1 Tax=Nonomuraea solani TaxID=1144553 RepID=A0A1H5T601_9ACTN|nr:CHAP domain-containing protein [Nonomuraea solani]